MVAFGKLITSAVALAVPALAALSPAQIVSNIEMITQKSMALQAPAKQITLINAPLLAIGQGPIPKIILGFSDIVSTGTNAISQMQGTAPVPAGAESDDIAEAFRSVSWEYFFIFTIALINFVVRSRPPGSPEHLDWKGWIAQHCSFCWRAPGCSAPPD